MKPPSAVGGRKWLWVVLVPTGLLFAAIGWAPKFMGGAHLAKMEDFGPAPAFVLTNQKGRKASHLELRGQPWVANFIFTRCYSVCPVLTAKLANLVERTRDLGGVHFVSISVDPTHDTPEVLAAYAERFEADAERWWFLTGPLSAVKETVEKGFKISMAPGKPSAKPTNANRIDIVHGEHFVLVDGAGTLRGYFGSDRQGLTALEQQLRRLASD